MGSAAKRKINSKGPSTAAMKDSELELQYQTKIEALSTLTKISNAIGFMPMELKASLQFLVEETRMLFDAYGCAIFPLDKSIEI